MQPYMLCLHNEKLDTWEKVYALLKTHSKFLFGEQVNFES